MTAEPVHPLVQVHTVRRLLRVHGASYISLGAAAVSATGLADSAALHYFLGVLMSVLLAVIASCFLLFAADLPVVAWEAGSGAVPIFEPPPTTAAFREFWVAPYAETSFWTDPTDTAEELGTVPRWTALLVALPQIGHRLFVWDPRSDNYAWVDAEAVGPIDPTLADEQAPPLGARVLWSGDARVTMYTCVELGGCAPTASGLWPEVGMVAVDPRVIPLGSRVWIQGLGTFLAADTGSLVKGAHIDVFGVSYRDAIDWGVQRLPIVVFEQD